GGRMDYKKKQMIKDIVTLVILAAFMLFVCKGVPALMGGAQDANGNPLTISYSVSADALE
ncbi:MAG: hypothetical protein IIT43_07685, partial [Clostridia bacterium]|nr:hypothetical protein [Clostridia bacterium]